MKCFISCVGMFKLVWYDYFVCNVIIIGKDVGVLLYLVWYYG